MPKFPEGLITIVALIALAAWLLIGLPLLYLPSGAHVHGEILGVKYGEWLLFLATMALFWATWRLVRGAERTAERQLRAYVDVREIKMFELNSGFNPNIHIIIKNFGQTPAREITNTFQVRNLDRPRERDFSLTDATIGEMGDLAPGEQTVSQTGIPFNQWEDMKPGLITRDFALYIYGRIDYFDVFEREQRTSEYRFVLLIDSHGIKDEMTLVVRGHAGNRTN